MQQRKHNYSGFGRWGLYSDPTAPMEMAVGTGTTVGAPRLQGDPAKSKGHQGSDCDYEKHMRVCYDRLLTSKVQDGRELRKLRGI